RPVSGHGASRSAPATSCRRWRRGRAACDGRRRAGPAAGALPKDSSMRLLVLALVALLLPDTGAAASFDCAKAKSPLERAICGNRDLSAADEELARAYADGLRKLGDSAGILRGAQRRWLQDLPGRLARAGAEAVLHDYKDRLDELQAIPDFPPPD